MKITQRAWRRYAAFAGLLGTASVAIDVPFHAWPQLGVSLGATGTTLFFARRGFRVAEHREAHKPDYAKIARLEVELGLVEPPKPPPPVNETVWAANGGGDYVRRIEPPRPGLAKPDGRCAFCIPGRGPVAPNSCPFFPVCQQ